MIGVFSMCALFACNTVVPGSKNITSATLSVTSGDLQTANPGLTLPKPMTVTVNNTYGNPLSGVVIDWAVSSGNGVLENCGTLTNITGQVQCNYRVGAGTLSLNTITATIDGTPTSVTFSVTPGILLFTSNWSFRSSLNSGYSLGVNLDLNASSVELTPANQSDQDLSLIHI